MSAKLLYSNWYSSFWDEFKAAITPELKLQLCDSASAFVKSAFSGFWRLLALAVIGFAKSTIRVPKTNLQD
jgi:hypothetical protein